MYGPWVHDVAANPAYIQKLWDVGGCERLNWSAVAPLLQQQAHNSSTVHQPHNHPSLLQQATLKLQDNRHFVTADGDSCEEIGWIWDELEDEAPENRSALSLSLLDEVPRESILDCPEALLALHVKHAGAGAGGDREAQPQDGLDTSWQIANSSSSMSSSRTLVLLAATDLLDQTSLSATIIRIALELEAQQTQPWQAWCKWHAQVLMLSHPLAGFVYGWIFSMTMCLGFGYLVARAGCAGLDLSTSRLRELHIRTCHVTTMAELLDDCAMGFAATLCKGIPGLELAARVRHAVAVETYPEPVQARIEAVIPSFLAHRITQLHLAHNRLHRLPSQVSLLVSLTSINVDGNELTSLPDEVCNLPNLVHLACRNNAIVELPRALGSLRRLQVIAADNNQLRRVPASIGLCRSVKSISLRCNQLECLPESLLCLGDCLVALFISGNTRLRALPGTSFMRTMAMLQTVELDHELLVDARLASPLHAKDTRPLPTAHGAHTLKHLAVRCSDDAKQLAWAHVPPSVTTLRAFRAEEQHVDAVLAPPGTLRLYSMMARACGIEQTLTRLCLDGMGLGSVPNGIKHMHVLHTLSLEDNQLTTVPAELGALMRLRILRIKGNSLAHVPDSLGKLRLLHFTIDEGVVGACGMTGIDAISFLRNKIYTLCWSLHMHRELVYDGVAAETLRCVALCAQRCARQNTLPFAPAEIWLHVFGTIPGRYFLPTVAAIESSKS